MQLDESLANAVRGVYTFRVNGTICHRMGPLLPATGQRPAFAQIYIYDPKMQIEHRRSIFDHLDRLVLINIQDMLTAVNPFASVIQSAAERLRDQPNIDLQIRISGDAAREGRQYAAPAAAEVAVIVPSDQSVENGRNPRDVVYITKEGRIFHINEMHAYYDPLHYVLMFPRGELGWTIDIRQSDDNRDVHEEVDNEDTENNNSRRTTVTVREFYAYILQMREGSYIHFYGRLLHEFIVDMYLKLETSRLLFIRLNQDTLRADVYQGAADAVFCWRRRCTASGQKDRPSIFVHWWPKLHVSEFPGFNGHRSRLGKA